MTKKNHGQESNRDAWARIIAKAWTDEAFRRRLEKNPKEVLKEEGMKLPQEVHIHTNSDKVIHLVIPKSPEGVMSDEELRKLAAGSGCGARGSGCNTGTACEGSAATNGLHC